MAKKDSLGLREVHLMSDAIRCKNAIERFIWESKRKAMTRMMQPFDEDKLKLVKLHICLKILPCLAHVRYGSEGRPGVNFMSQKIRGIPPGIILLLTLMTLFYIFWLNECLLSSFEEAITLKLSRIYSQEEKTGGKFQLKLEVKFLLAEFLLLLTHEIDPRCHNIFSAKNHTDIQM